MVTISSVNLEDPRDPACVAVNATGPKGGKIEWCIFFRHGFLAHGYCYAPPTGYHAEHLIPIEIKQAAKQFFHAKEST